MKNIKEISSKENIRLKGERAKPLINNDGKSFKCLVIPTEMYGYYPIMNI